MNKKVGTIFLLFLLILIFALCFLLTLAVLTEPPQNFPIFSYLPGTRASSNFTCNPTGGPYPHSNVMYCFNTSTNSLEGETSVSVDGARKIQNSYIFTASNDLRVGDLINEWGSPLKVSYYYNSFELVWPDRFAFGIDKGFSPDSPIDFIALGTDEGTYQPWQGFKSQH